MVTPVAGACADARPASRNCRPVIGRRVCPVLGCGGRHGDSPAELEPAFQAAVVSGTPYLLDVRCDRAFSGWVNPQDLR